MYPMKSSLNLWWTPDEWFGDFMFACALYLEMKSFEGSLYSDLSDPEDFFHPQWFTWTEITKWWLLPDTGVSSRSIIFQQRTAKPDERIINSYSELLPACWKYSFLPYEHTSFESLGKDEWYNSGTQHYWGYAQRSHWGFWYETGRFNAEYGFQSFLNSVRCQHSVQKWMEAGLWHNETARNRVCRGNIHQSMQLLYMENPSGFMNLFTFSPTQARVVIHCRIKSLAESLQMYGEHFTGRWMIAGRHPPGRDYFETGALQYAVQKDSEIAVLSVPDKVGEEQHSSFRQRWYL